MLGGFWRYAASARGEAWAALKRETLVCAVAALRARQARVLPRFAAAEDAARLAEVMSFALAACVVAERFAAVAGRATAPGWRPLTDDVPESAVVGDTPAPPPLRCPAPRPARGRGRARLARPGARRRSAPSPPTSATARASFARSPARRSAGSVSPSTAGRPRPPPTRCRRKKPRRTPSAAPNHKPHRPSPRPIAHRRP